MGDSKRRNDLIKQGIIDEDNHVLLRAKNPKVKAALERTKQHDSAQRNMRHFASRRGR